MDLRRAPGGALVLNDAYNANPTSMAAALRALAALPGPGRRIAILGPMTELANPAQAHAEIARLTTDLGIELTPTGTDLYGLKAIDDPITALGLLRTGDAVLVKASRAAGLESLAEALLTN